MSDTLVVNLFAGPGTGKSTTAALTFGKLKQAGINAELATEYAKDLVWEGRHHALHFQPYIIAKQMHRIHRVLGKVDVAVTDSPILFGLVYGEDNNWYWEQWVQQVFRSWNTLNIQLLRDSEVHPFNEAGRTQTEDEAVAIDDRIDWLLKAHMIDHTRVEIGPAASDVIVELVKDRLGLT